MKTLRSLLSFRRWVFVVCAIALLLGVARSDAQDVPLNGIVLNATPNPVTSGAPSATFSAQLSGNSQTPTGTVNFFLSQSSFCDDGGYLNLGTATVDGNGAATLTFIYLYLIPTGATNLCATYSGDFYYAANETTSSGDPNALSLVFTKIVANVTFSAPASAVQNQPVTLTVTTASLPAGGPVPTGSITIADGQANYGPFPLVAGTASFSLNGLAPGEHSYGVNYSGDVNYLATGNSGTLFVEGGLVAVNPPVVAAGSGDTTITLVGQGFAANLNPVAQLTPSNGPTQQLATTYVSPTRLQAVVPASLLTTAQSEALTVLTGTTSSDALTFTIYNKVTDTVAAAATPTTLTYGQTGPVSLGANVTRGSITEASVPSGAITFSIGGNALSATAPLALTAAGGSYNTGSFPNLDSSPGKILSADFNGDGFADSISLGLNNGDYLQLLLSSGLEFFQNEFEVYIGCQVGDFAVADLNKDGIPDIVAACLDASAQTPYGVYILGNGDGTFQLPVAFASAGNSTITSPGYIAAGDFNGDGATDIALIGSTGTLQVFNGAQPFGAFTPQAAATYPMPGGSPVNVLAVDFNQDGKSDLAMLEYVYNSTTGTGYVLVLTSNGDGTFTSLPQQTFTSMKFEFSSQLLAVTDLTGDGYPSLLVADPESTLESGNGALLIYQNSETGQLNTAVEQPVTNLTTVAGTPFPSIGKPAATPKSPYNVFYTTIDNTNMTSPNLSLQPVSLTVQGGTLNPQNGPVISGFAYPSYCDCDTVYVPMALGDFNGDGYLDVVVTANQLPNSNTLQVAPVYFSGDSTASEVSAIPVLPAGQYNLIASYPGDTYFA
ncbi:MAG TPA: FG-GAP-like repeat-containing protein, partial [Terriglobales bacterium]